MMPSNNALKLSAWLYLHEPKLFQQLLTRANQRAVTLGRLGRLGFLGDDSGLDVITVTPDAITPADFSSVGVTPDVSLSSPSMDVGSLDITGSSSAAISTAVAAPPEIDSSISDASQSSGSFWDSVGSGISSAASAVAKVASSVLSPQSLAAAGNATAAYFNAQAKTAQAQVQAATVQTQLARVSAGYAPAPITYTRNPITGALTPVYQTNTGSMPLTGGLLSQLSSPGGLSPLVLIGGSIALVIVLSLAASR